MRKDAVLRSFNKFGIQKFRNLIGDLQADGKSEIDLGWIFDNNNSEILNDEVYVSQINFENKLKAAKHILSKIELISKPNKFYDAGLWAWLSAYYFDIVCPEDDDGNRNPHKAYRHIPPNNRNWRTVYRHLLAGPVRLYDIHKIDIKIIFHEKIHVLGDFMEQLASRQEIAASKGAMKAADLIYWDSNLNEPKTGARSTDRSPGTLRRYVDVLRQLMMTYDIYSLDADSILELLPRKEFAPWMPNDV